jgi:type IV pilus assembly protein PilC
MAVLEKIMSNSEKNNSAKPTAKSPSTAVRKKPQSLTDQQDLLQKIINFKVELGPSKKDVLNFSNQLSVMVRAGISLPEALDLIAMQMDKKKAKFRAIIIDLKEMLEGGSSFSQALSEYQNVFGELYINMVAAAEVSGSMSSMLDKLAGYLDQEAETRQQIIGAMVYPVIIALMAVSVTIFLLMFVLPRFLKIFEGKEHLLPGSTKLLMFLSSGMKNYWYIIFPVIFAAIGAFLFFIRTKHGKYWWHDVKLKLPVVKKLTKSISITRGLHTMGVLTHAGVPILDTLMITAQISGNVHFSNMWRSVHNSVKEGQKIASSMANFKLMPMDVVQMIRSGEDSGTLGEVLAEVSDFYARELKAVIKMVTSMIEPVMIVIMGLLVGFIAMSIILPIFKMSSAVK